jgi:pilus assembly protein CpaF
MKQAIVWGVLKKFMDDKHVHEIIIDRADDILIAGPAGVKKGPKLTQAALVKLAQQLIKCSPDPKALSAEIVLPGNILVSIVMPPIAPEGPFLRIWKMPDQQYSLDDMVKWEVMSKNQKEYLANLIQTNKSILVAGSAGSGKTTLLITMLHALPEEYHLVTIEQYGDLNMKRARTARLVAPHRQSQEMSQLVDIASRARGDCLALAYAQGAEILPFIELLRDGHQGMMCMSGENVFDAVKRLEYKISAHAPWMTLEDIRYSITQAFGHIIFQTREADGKRKVSHLAKLEYVEGEIQINPVKF